GLPVDVLRAHEQVGALARRLRRRLQRHGGWEEPYLALLARGVARAERLEVGTRLVGPDAHLPVGGGPEGAAHASLTAATPASGPPRGPAARSGLGAATAPRGRISFAPALARMALARSSLSRSTSEPPTPNPMARKNVLAIAPPMRIWSTRGNSASITSILPEILAPPSTARNGRRGWSSASPR